MTGASRVAAGVLLLAALLSGCGQADDNEYCTKAAVVTGSDTSSDAEVTKVLEAMDDLAGMTAGQESEDWTAFREFVEEHRGSDTSEQAAAALDPAMDRLQKSIANRCSASTRSG
ncbi:MAG: hypothetical protein LWW86_11245 [Micrococcales bacterium]|nr:hypothetical protein [Micrococcales bacterium]